MADLASVSFDAVFAADLHLQASDGAGVDRATRLVQLCARRTKHLYLLGDVFDLWTSAGMLRMEEMQAFYEALREAAAQGLEIVFLPGNRDFNLTPADGRRLGIRVEGEVLGIRAGGVPLCLTHGDRFLLHDRSYQRYKRVIRSLPLRFLARRLPDFVSLGMARRLRRYSNQAVAAKPTPRLAIVPAAVLGCFEEGARFTLCGHVHRAERVAFGEGRELLVLPAFLEDPRALVLAAGEFWLCDLEGGLVPFDPPAGPTQGA